MGDWENSRREGERKRREGGKDEDLRHDLLSEGRIMSRGVPLVALEESRQAVSRNESN
jgi:hypothetical protein